MKFGHGHQMTAEVLRQIPADRLAATGRTARRHTLIVRPRASENSAATALMSSERPGQLVGLPDMGVWALQDGRDDLHHITRVDGRCPAAAEWQAIMPSLAIDSAAQGEKNGCWRNTVARTCTAGNPAQFSTCSPSQCWRYAGGNRSSRFSSLFDAGRVRDIDEHLQIATFACDGSGGGGRLHIQDADTLMPKYMRRQPSGTPTSSTRVRSPTTTSAPVRSASARS